jgi:hypothetical protein
MTSQELELRVASYCHMSQLYPDQNLTRTVHPLALGNLVTSQVHEIRVVCSSMFKIYSNQCPR